MHLGLMLMGCSGDDSDYDDVHGNNFDSNGSVSCDGDLGLHNSLRVLSLLRQKSIGGLLDRAGQGRHSRSERLQPCTPVSAWNQ